MSTPFSILLNSAMDRRGSTTLEVPDDWSIGRTTFGGLQAAIALRAMRTVVPEDSPLRTLQTTFVAPVPTGRIEARAEVLRSGKNTTHVEARLMSEDQTLAVMLGVFGTGRSSAVSVVPEQPMVEVVEGTLFHFLPGVTPNCVQHFEGRWLHGAPPATGDTETRHVVDVRMRDSGPASEYHVLAIADFMPPIAFSLLPRPVTGGSMTWMLELITDHLGGLPLEGWRLDAELVAGRDGYTSQSVMVWGPWGRPVAISRQSMFVFG